MRYTPAMEDWNDKRESMRLTALIGLAVVGVLVLAAVVMWLRDWLGQ